MISLEMEDIPEVKCRTSLFVPKKKRYITCTWTPDDSSRIIEGPCRPKPEEIVRRPSDEILELELSLAALVAALTAERPLARPGSDGDSDLIPWVVTAKFAQKDVYERLSLPTKAWQCSKRRMMVALSASLPLLPQDCISIICDNVEPKKEQEPIKESRPREPARGRTAPTPT